LRIIGISLAFCWVSSCWRGFGVMICLFFSDEMIEFCILISSSSSSWLFNGSVSGGYDSKGYESKATFRCKMHFKAFVFILVFVVSWGSS
jgi:hypothetical protein